MNTKALCVGVILVTSFVIGCASPPDLRQKYYDNKMLELSNIIVNQIDKNSDDFAQKNLYYASSSLELGDERRALEALGRTCVIADNIDLSGVGLPFAFSDKNKVMQGEPYERSMAHLYRGILLYRLGIRENSEDHLNNARASFTKALEHDKATGDEKFREDNALAHYLLGKAFLLLNDEGNARVAFEKCKQVFPTNSYVALDKAQKNNFTLLIGVGVGPQKVQGKGFYGIGATDEIVTYEPEQKDPQIYIDGTLCGKGELILDVNEQARHRSPQTEKVLASMGRQVLKDQLSKSIPFFGGMLVSTESDLRCWDVIPAKIYLFNAQVSSGVHSVRIKFSGDNEESVKRYNQTYYYLPVQENKPDNLYLFLSIKNKHNAGVKK